MESSKNQSNRSGMLTGLTTLSGYFAVPLSIGGTCQCAVSSAYSGDGDVARTRCFRVRACMMLSDCFWLHSSWNFCYCRNEQDQQENASKEKWRSRAKELEDRPTQNRRNRIRSTHKSSTNP